MTTPAPGNPISMNDVYLETNLTRNMDNFFAVSQVGGGGGLMYHNLGMGPAGSQTAAAAIYTPDSTGTNMNLSAWYNYTQDADMHFTYDFRNNNPDNDVRVDIFFDDGSLTVLYPVTNFTVTSGGGLQQAEILTGLLANTSFPSGLYVVVVSVQAFYGGPPPPPGAGVVPDPTYAYDTDGVGPGTFRQFYTIPPFDMFNPINNFILVEGNISGNGIYNNKRTTVEVAFT